MAETVEHKDDDTSSVSSTGLTKLPFNPITREHILNCSYHSWYPKFRTITPKSRLVPLNKPFLDYLRADGIILPSDDAENAGPEWSDDDSGVFSASDDHDSDDEQEDVTVGWRGIHAAIRDTIASLGGRVVPKLNWSAPKDATWMNANTMECRNPSEIYLLLKSSDFITHDLEHAFDDTATSTDPALTSESIPYHLVLRKAVGQWNPSVEFRCFVRNRKLLCISQRDLVHYDFLAQMAPKLRSLIKEFFDVRIQDNFPDEDFVFDVYVPTPYNRVWLVDFDPWAPRTDPLLYSWLEILEMPEPPSFDDEAQPPESVRLYLNGDTGAFQDQRTTSDSSNHSTNTREDDLSDSDDSDDADEEFWLPELRLVSKSDPEAFGINAAQYSAHKLPKDVVDASQTGEGLREFARDWQNILAKRQREEEVAESSEND